MNPNEYESYHRTLQTYIHDCQVQDAPEIWWDDLVNLFTSDLEKTIHFILTSCTDEELVGLSDVYEDLMERTHSRRLLQTIEMRTEKIVNPVLKREAAMNLPYAKEILDDFQKIS